MILLYRIRDPAANIKLVFVTPEKVAKSDALLRVLDQLYLVGRLDRIVVDEAHCGGHQMGWRMPDACSFILVHQCLIPVS